MLIDEAVEFLLAPGRDIVQKDALLEDEHMRGALGEEGGDGIPRHSAWASM